MEKVTNFIKRNPIKLSLLPLITAYVLFIVCLSHFLRPSTNRVTRNSPSITGWVSILFVIDCNHLFFGAALLSVPSEDIRLILTMKYVPIMCIIKAINYLIIGICLAINPIPDGLGSTMAFLSCLVNVSLILIRKWYFVVELEDYKSLQNRND